MLRHGKTGLQGRYIGSTDVSLSSEGIDQIKDLQNELRNHTFDKIYSSPMLRCRQSCEILLPGKTVDYNEKLKEIDFGRWEGLTFAEISSQDPEIVNEWADNPMDFTFPEGESVDFFNTRVQGIAVDVLEEQDEKILLVCHGGVIRSLLCYFLAIDPRNYILFQIQKGTYSTVDLFGNHGVLTGLNLQ